MTPMEWLEASAVATAVRQSIWLYPAIETAHVLGLSVLVGSAAMWDLRLLGVSRRLPVTGMAAHLLPAARAGFALAVVSGTLLFASDAVAISGNPAFRLKLVALALAVLNTVVFHYRVFRSVEEWDVSVSVPLEGRVAAAASLVLWVSVLVAGRLIAYV